MLSRVFVGAPLHDRLGEGRLLGDVPRLADEGAAVARLELVAPDAAGDRRPSGPGPRVCQAMRRFSSNSTTVLTIEYGSPIFIDMPNWLPEREPLLGLLGLAHAARTVDVAVAGGVGEQVEDRLGRSRDEPLHGLGVGHRGIVGAGRCPADGWSRGR